MVKFMRDIILGMYKGDITDRSIDSIVCRNCRHRDKNGECPVDLDADEPCLMSDEDTIDAFLKHKITENFDIDESMNDLLRECGFEE